MNLAESPETIPGLVFEMVRAVVGDITTARIEWLAERQVDPDELLSPPRPDDPSALERAEAFLLLQLADGPRPTRDLRNAAAEAGVGWRTVERAKDALGVRALPPSASGLGVWTWELRQPPPVGGVGGLPTSAAEQAQRAGATLEAAQ